MNATAEVILILYTVFTIIGVALGLVIFRTTRVGFHIRVADREELEKREGYWGVTAVAMLVVLLLATIFSLPYWTANSGANEPQTIQVTGRQFAWTIDPPVVRENVTTKIVATATDVNHGLGLYDPNGVLIKQIQVVPGATQNLIVTFHTPGIWKIRCLEFCGVNHHLMQGTLRVTR